MDDVKCKAPFSELRAVFSLLIATSPLKRQMLFVFPLLPNPAFVQNKIFYI